MDLKSELPTTIRKVTDILVKNLVIKSMEKMAAEDKITTLNVENKSGVLLHPSYWLSGVYYKDKNENEDENMNENEKNAHKYDIGKY